jgi:hypothetical protein
VPPSFSITSTDHVGQPLDRRDVKHHRPTATIGRCTWAGPWVTSRWRAVVRPAPNGSILHPTYLGPAPLSASAAGGTRPWKPNRSHTHTRSADGPEAVFLVELQHPPGMALPGGQGPNRAEQLVMTRMPSKADELTWDLLATS